MKQHKLLSIFLFSILLSSTIYGEDLAPIGTKNKKIVGEVDLFLETERVKTKGDSFENFVLNGRGNLFKRCIRYDSNRHCIEEDYYLPLGLSLRLGDKNEISQFRFTVYKDAIHDYFDRYETHCKLSVGNISFEEMNGGMGSLWNFSLADGECNTIIKVLNSGNIKFLLGAGLAGGGTPFVFYGAGSLSGNPLAEKRDVSGLTFGGRAYSGIELLNKVQLSAFVDGFFVAGKADENSTFRHYKRLSYGAILNYSLLPNDSLSIYGKWSIEDHFVTKYCYTGTDEHTMPKYDNSTSNDRVNIIGIGIKGHFDLFKDK